MTNWQIIEGDCIGRMTELPTASVDFVLVDPPYGTTACKWDEVIPFGPMWQQLLRISRPHRPLVFFAAQPFSSALVMSNPRLFRYEWAWVKNKKTNQLNAKKMPMGGHELILVFADSMPPYNPQYNQREGPRSLGGTTTRTTVYGKSNSPAYSRPQTTISPDTALFFPVENGLHPTQKPVGLLRYLIRTYSNESDMVLDFTCGSGSTGVACLLEGRNFIGIEQDSKYVQIARQRLQDTEKQLFANVSLFPSTL